jgi:hypothetical protein
MAIKLPPPPRKIIDKGNPPEHGDTRENLRKPEPGNTIALNFRVAVEFKRDFKVAAATAGITQSELLMEAFHLWHQKNG